MSTRGTRVLFHVASSLLLLIMSISCFLHLHRDLQRKHEKKTRWTITSSILITNPHRLLQPSCSSLRVFHREPFCVRRPSEENTVAASSPRTASPRRTNVGEGKAVNLAIWTSLVLAWSPSSSGGRVLRPRRATTAASSPWRRLRGNRRRRSVWAPGTTKQGEISHLVLKSET